MKEIKFRRLCKFNFSFMYWGDSSSLILNLLILAVIFVIGDSTIKPLVSFAQEEEKVENSLSFDKNINIIYVNPESGDDSGSGKRTAPVKTITKALELAAEGDKIQLSSGTYSETTGEKFPLIIERKVTLKGNVNNQGIKTIIKGSGSFTSPTGAGQNVTIAALKDAERIAGVTITNEHSRGHGLWIESSAPEIISNTFTRNGNTGVSANGKSSPLIKDNYFYNNSGNGLLVYGESQPKVVENTFEQTGFGVSLVQNSLANLTGNYFDGNRIGIILEGNSQAVLRENEIINSLESGLTAIANSRADLGTNQESGENIFRSNKKLDIQNATSNQIVAVGTETNGNIKGEVDFDRGEFSVASSRDRDSRPLLTLLDFDSEDDSSLKTSSSSTTPESSPLPSPPPVSEQKTVEKEFIFTPSSSVVSETPEPEPVPFLPQINNSALDSSSSQVSSLSDLLGARNNVSIKYKVLVEARDQHAEARVRSLYPEAFSTSHQGRSVLQVGAFNNWNKAKQARVSLESLGLETYILE